MTILVEYWRNVKRKIGAGEGIVLLYFSLPLHYLLYMKLITLTCTHCKKSFERSLKQYNDHCLRRKHNPFCSQSCACTYRNLHTPKEIRSKYKRFDITSTAGNRKDEYSPFKYFITKCKERKRDFDIDLSYLKELWNTQKGICPYTGLKMDLPNTTRNHSSFRSLKKASLDRIDSSKGYIKGNVEFVCLLINFAKNSYDKEDVVNFISELKMVGTPRIELGTGI